MVETSYLPTMCNHCDNPSCMAACAPKAITKRQDGLVLIDPAKCTGCSLCAMKCPVNCISGEKRKPYTINQLECIKCGTCFEVCKFDAVIRK